MGSNIALKLHRDHGSVVLEGENQGNFRALLRFCVDAEDSILEEHFRTAGKNAQYLDLEFRMIDLWALDSGRETKS